MNVDSFIDLICKDLKFRHRAHRSSGLVSFHCFTLPDQTIYAGGFDLSEVDRTRANAIQIADTLNNHVQVQLGVVAVDVRRLE